MSASRPLLPKNASATHPGTVGLRYEDTQLGGSLGSARKPVAVPPHRRALHMSTSHLSLTRSASISSGDPFAGSPLTGGQSPISTGRRASQASLGLNQAARRSSCSSSSGSGGNPFSDRQRTSGSAVRAASLASNGTMSTRGRLSTDSNNVNNPSADIYRLPSSTSSGSTASTPARPPSPPAKPMLAVPTGESRVSSTSAGTAGTHLSSGAALRMSGAQPAQASLALGADMQDGKGKKRQKAKRIAKDFGSAFITSIGAAARFT